MKKLMGGLLSCYGNFKFGSGGSPAVPAELFMLFPRKRGASVSFWFFFTQPACFCPASHLLCAGQRPAGGGDAKFTMYVGIGSMLVFPAGLCGAVRRCAESGDPGGLIAMGMDWLGRSVAFLLRYRRGNGRISAQSDVRDLSKGNCLAIGHAVKLQKKTDPPVHPPADSFCGKSLTTEKHCLY